MATDGEVTVVASMWALVALTAVLVALMVVDLLRDARDR